MQYDTSLAAFQFTLLTLDIAGKGIIYLISKYSITLRIIVSKKILEKVTLMIMYMLLRQLILAKFQLLCFKFITKS